MKSSAESERPLVASPRGSARRVVLLNGSYAPSLLNFRRRLIEMLVANGLEVHVSAPDFSAQIIRELSSLGAEAHEVPLARTSSNPLSDITYFRAMRGLISKIGAHMVISYTVKPNIWASLAAKSLGVQSASMVTGLGYAFMGQSGTRGRLSASAARLLYRAATAGNEVVIFQNPDDRADFVAYGCLQDTSKARLVNGSGVDLSWFEVTPLPSSPTYLMVSRLLQRKGVREYCEAAVALLKARRDCRFLLVGYLDEGPEGIDPSELERWQAAGLEYLGQMDDVRSAIAQASVYVLPSYREGTPRSVLEAMAMGRPIITTDVPGCRETVVDGLNGYLVPAQDTDALVKAVSMMADDAPLRERMGRASRRLCVEKYDVEAVTTQLIDHLGLDQRSETHESE